MTFTALTGLRGVGALWVLWHHILYGMGWRLADAGYLGVDLFFLLSGFILSHAHPEAGQSWTAYRSFIWARFARIFPMHWAAMLVVLIVLLAYPPVLASMPRQFEWPGFVSSLFLVQDWGFGYRAPWNGPAWSLSTEWLASLLFPLFLLGAARAARPRTAALGVLACLGLLTLVLYLSGNTLESALTRPGIARTFCEFGAGCLLYRIHLAGWRPGKAVLTCAAGLVLTGVFVPGLEMLAVAGFALLVLLAAQPTGALQRILGSRPMLFLGEISYSVYLLHWILLQASDRIAAGLHLGVLATALWDIGFAALVLLLSTATFHLIEVPSRRWLRSLTRAKLAAGLGRAQAPRPAPASE